MCKADQLTVLTENYRNMANCCVIFSTTVVCLAAILVGLYYKQVIPEGLPDDQLSVLDCLVLVGTFSVLS